MLIIILILIICIIIGFWYLYGFLKETIVLMKALQTLPGPPKNNFICGNILPLFTTPDKILNIVCKWSNDYNPIFKVWSIHLGAGVLSSPDDFELIMSNPSHIKKSLVYDLLQGWLGFGLLTSFGTKWHLRRKILTPAFHFSILQQFISIFNDETDKLIENLKNNCDKPFVYVNEYINQFTLKTIARTSMGIKMESDCDKGNTYKKTIHKLGKILLYRFLRPWLYYDLIYKLTPHYYREKKLTNILHKFTEDVIREREKKININTQSHTESKRLAMLDLLLRNKLQESNINDLGIREEVDTFMFEGHDTTSVAICFALMLIACHPNVQNNLIKEMSKVLGDVKKKPTYNDLQNLKYMDRTIKEVLRLYPSVYFISRVLGENITTKSGYNLPKDTIVFLFIYALHHDPEIYPNPEIFDPDRFLLENMKNRHPFAYVPFSAGPRNCIGQRFALLELKTVLCGILANFILEPVDTPSSIALVVDIVLRTKNNIRIKFVIRENN